MQEELVEVFLLGKQYTVPAELTIMDAMEYAGYKLVRGCGCRSGFCGGCGRSCGDGGGGGFWGRGGDRGDSSQRFRRGRGLRLGRDRRSR